MRRMAVISLTVLLLAGCADAFDLNATRNVSERFMEKLARGDINGAYELCDPNALSRDTLDDIANKAEYANLYRKFKGLDHGEGGQKDTSGAYTDVRLSPAKIRGEDGWIAHFALRKYDEGWKIIGFRIEPQ
jgi:hypothetical protein